MNKLVYLHELDSVRNTKAEMIKAQQAMYEEIVINGNTVVLTFNQFADSKSFLIGINDKKQSEHIVELFKNGKFKLSNYVDVVSGEEIRTASQYMQHSIKKNLTEDSAFVFSGMSIGVDEKEILKAMNIALATCNPSYMNEVKDSDNEERIESIKKYITILLNLSIEEKANNPIKKGKIVKYIDIMHAAYVALEKHENYIKVVECLRKAEGKIAQSSINSRSLWLLELVKNEDDSENILEEIYMAKAVINLVYNYVVEDSINGVSKHYNDESTESFEQDFINRFELFWTEFKNGEHDSLKKNHKPEEKYVIEFPKWDTAVRVTKENELFTLKKKVKKKKNKIEKNEKQVKKNSKNINNKKQVDNAVKAEMYEIRYSENKKKWSRKIIRNVILQAIAAVIYIIAMLTFDKLTGTVEECIRAVIGMFGFNMGVVATRISNFVIFTVILGAIISFVSSRIKLPDILESVKNIVYCIKDIFVVKLTKKGISYVNKKRNDMRIK